MRRFVFLLLMFFVVASFGCREQSKEEIFRQGMAFVNAGNYQAAITLFKDALDKDPNYIDARMQLGVAYLETGKLDKAENELSKVRRQDPGNILVALRLAEIYIKNKHPDQSIELLDSLQNSDPDNAEVMRLLAVSKVMSGDFSAAEDLYRKSLLTRPGDPSTQLGFAQLLYMTKRLDEGDKLIDAVIAKHPDNTDAYNLLLRKALSQGDRESAIATLSKIKAINPEDIYALYMLGMLSLDTGKIEESRQISADLMARLPKHPAGYRIEGVALYLIGDYKASIEKLQKSLIGMPDLPGFYFVGLAYYQLGQFEQALSSFQKALDKSPTHQQSRLMIAQTFLKQGRTDDCIREVKIVIGQDVSNANAHNILGSAYLAQKKYDLAMAEIETAIQIDPNLPQAHLKKGLFNLAMGNPEQGEIDLTNAVNVAPEILNSRLLLAAYYLSQHNYPMALQVLKEGLAISPDSAVIYNMMAAAYFGQNNPEAAVQSLQKAKKIKPEYLTPYFNLANYLVSQKDYQSALLEYQAVLQFAPDSLQALFKAASLYEFTGQNDVAELLYEKAAQTKTSAGYMALATFQLRNGRENTALQTLKDGYGSLRDNKDLIMAYAEMLKKAGQFEEALLVYIHLEEVHPGWGKPLLFGTHLLKGDFSAAKEIADLAVAEDPSSRQGYLFQAAIHEHRSESALAEKALLKGIDATNGDLILQMNLARLYTKQGAADEALKIYDSLLSDKPDLLPVLFAKATIYDFSGKKKIAQELYEKVLGIDENYVPAINNLAYLLLDVYSNNKRALDLAIKGFRLKPEDPSIIDTLGYALLKNGQVDKSIVFLNKAVNFMPQDATIRLHLARAYKAAGKRDEAAAILAAINVSNSGKDQVKEAKELLNQLN